MSNCTCERRRTVDLFVFILSIALTAVIFLLLGALFAAAVLSIVAGIIAIIVVLAILLIIRLIQLRSRCTCYCPVATAAVYTAQNNDQAE